MDDVNENDKYDVNIKDLYLVLAAAQMMQIGLLAQINFMGGDYGLMRTLQSIMVKIGPLSCSGIFTGTYRLPQG